MKKGMVMIQKTIPYLDEKIFSPLEMENTISAVNSGDPIKGLAQGYITAYGRALPWTKLEKMFSGAGGIVTTASDMENGFPCIPIKAGFKMTDSPTFISHDQWLKVFQYFITGVSDEKKKIINNSYINLIEEQNKIDKLYRSRK